MKTRDAAVADAPAIARIYNEGIDDRVATFELVSRVFVENTASRNLLRSIGFREVGVYERHGQLDGVWRDVVIVEKLLE
jgi:L-amino acid N-acyltransferase YncA